MATNTTFPWKFPAAFDLPIWQIDGVGIVRPTREIATHRTLTLTFRVTTSLLKSGLRPLKQNEGKVDVLVTDSGGHTSVDRADGANTFTLNPPSSRRPLRQVSDYHVTRYEEELVSQGVDEWDVEVEFVRESNRSDSPSISETPGAGEWELDTRYGAIATDHVDARFLGTGADGVERFELVMRLTMTQAHAFEAALSRLGGTRVRSIVDGSNRALDDTADSANTLGVDSPDSEGVVSTGDYVALDWESERLNDAFQSVSLTVAVEG